MEKEKLFVCDFGILVFLGWKDIARSFVEEALSVKAARKIEEVIREDLSTHVDFVFVKNRLVPPEYMEADGKMLLKELFPQLEL